MGIRKCGFVSILAGVLMLVFVLLATPLHIYGLGWGPKHVFGTIVSTAVIGVNGGSLDRALLARLIDAVPLRDGILV
jgi:hypothetical protein